MVKELRVGLLGTKFMGRAHSNAYGQVAKFFETPLVPVLWKACARDEAALVEFAERWGWQHATTDWRELVVDPEVELVDVGTPNHLHAKPALAALAAGKHVACEKPLAGTLEDARAMRDAAADAAGQTFVWFNYRRCPAIATAYRFVREGRLGRIYHVRARYLQNWGGPETPGSWRFRKELAGSGAHGDLNAHSIDLARFLTGDEIAEVHGAVARTFHPERPTEDGGTMKSDVDDALAFLATFESGTLGTFEASRVAGPHENANSIELNGELGSVRFDFENMNVLEFHDAADGPREGGWRRIQCTTANAHPFVANWWPPGHGLGYEHGFVNQVADMLRVLGGEEPEVPLADFADAYETQRVLAAALVAAEERRAVRLSTIE
ncbi:MAG: Gfo/Idh/MocA family oxidoreductase [Planctomycetota bacterium]